MIDRVLQGMMLHHMAANGGSADLAPEDDADAERYARNLLDLELQGLTKGGVTITDRGLRITGDSTLTNAGLAYLDRPNDVHMVLDGPATVKTLHQRIAGDPTLSDTERHDLAQSLDDMHPLALKAFGQELMERAVARGADTIPLLKKHTALKGSR
ncbi:MULTISPECIES: hypothetical protein [Komagataeibacter]|uniref:Uncharacterized protein n=2 Tax=Komagataeibacter TaxID=1434011 RepID=A0A318QVX0_9PROT|nr:MULTISPECIES: hypothetical protein [Komagataeibacter]GBR36958.1 hypothetical protein AA11826_1602 [Komagataeibacter oboediens DSM 11826]MBL7232549.1 hypothetical protein [Komagataeibacter oboediens]MBT0675206.1 hypothetical protein [Komagataeibacter oboediens]MBT0678817.1 hypothetical protein [Komagataeibacter oboediens]MBV1822961.1 hypothetical protein [Komagataeibacter oboediens]